MLKDLFPARHSGHVYLPQVPVGTVHVKGRNTVTWNRPTDLCIFPLYQKLSHHFWIYFSKDSSLKLSQRSNSAHNVFYLLKGLQRQTESCNRGFKVTLPSAYPIRASQPLSCRESKRAQPPFLPHAKLLSA